MVDIEKLKPLIIERLKPLNPDKIILFGSYAYGKPNEDSDIDLFILKDDLKEGESRDYSRKAKKRLRDIIFNYNTNGIDIIFAPTNEIYKREDYFFKEELLKKGKIWYERNSND
jgi:predicted nucleotidyltransferase